MPMTCDTPFRCRETPHSDVLSQDTAERTLPSAPCRAHPNTHKPQVRALIIRSDVAEHRQLFRLLSDPALILLLGDTSPRGGRSVCQARLGVQALYLPGPARLPGRKHTCPEQHGSWSYKVDVPTTNAASRQGRLPR